MRSTNDLSGLLFNVKAAGRERVITYGNLNSLLSISEYEF